MFSVVSSLYNPVYCGVCVCVCVCVCTLSLTEPESIVLIKENDAISCWGGSVLFLLTYIGGTLNTPLIAQRDGMLFPQYAL